MPYVARVNGAISGMFAQMQEGFAEEFLPDSNADVLAFLNPPPSITSVSARQFKLQLLSANLLDQVNGWIATQSRAVQIAYEYSGTFVRSEPMMAAGFTAMGFTDAQIDDFFTAASAL